MSDTHTPASPPTLWVVTEGIAGTENQCLAVAQAMGLTPVVKRIGLKQPWKFLSPYIGFECAGTFTGDALSTPWPDIVFAGGRKAIAACRYIRKESKQKTKIIFFQNPRINTRAFDLVIAPAHDNISGDNIIISKATPTKFNVQMINDIRLKNPSPFIAHGSQNITFIIGGGIAGRAMPDAEQQYVLDTCKFLLQQTDKNIFIIGSRRTPPSLVQSIRDIARAHHLQTWFPDDTAPNPYADAIAYADIVLVTADSPSMISDAASAGRPTYAGGTGLTKRHAALIPFLEHEGHIRMFNNDLSIYPHKLLDDVGHIAHEIRRKIHI